jgi:hypothetical protein
MKDFWKKINGRLRRADEKEIGHIKGKKYACPNCYVEIVVEGVEFGADIKCATCGSKMYERKE